MLKSKRASYFEGQGFLRVSNIAVVAIVAGGIACALLHHRGKKKYHHSNPDSIEYRLPSIEDDQRAIMNDVEYHAYQVRPGGQLSTPSMRNNMAHSISAMYDEIRQRRNKTLINIREINEMAQRGQMTRPAAQYQVAGQVGQYRSYVGTKWKTVFHKLGIPAI